MADSSAIYCEMIHNTTRVTALASGTVASNSQSVLLMFLSIEYFGLPQA
jgi:hypothetical protein